MFTLTGDRREKQSDESRPLDSLVSLPLSPSLSRFPFSLSRLTGDSRCEAVSVYTTGSRVLGSRAGDETRMTRS